MMPALTDGGGTGGGRSPPRSPEAFPAGRPRQPWPGRRRWPRLPPQVPVSLGRSPFSALLSYLGGSQRPAPPAKCPVTGRGSVQLLSVCRTHCFALTLSRPKLGLARHTGLELERADRALMVGGGGWAGTTPPASWPSLFGSFFSLQYKGLVSSHGRARGLSLYHDRRFGVPTVRSSECITNYPKMQRVKTAHTFTLLTRLSCGLGRVGGDTAQCQLGQLGD